MKNKNLIIMLAVVTISSVAFSFSTQKKPKSIVASSQTKNTVASFDTNMPPLVNYDYFEELVAEVKSHRAERLVSLETFLAKSKQAQTVILDSRSKAMYDLKHVKGAIHLNFSDFNQTDLNRMFSLYGGFETQILIYCNNNFYDSKAMLFDFQDQAFVSKSVQIFEEPALSFSLDNDKIQSLALNIPTYINLYGYGFKNVFELNEFIDVNSKKIQFEGTFDDGLERL